MHTDFLKWINFNLKYNIHILRDHPTSHFLVWVGGSLSLRLYVQTEISWDNYTPTHREGAILQSPCPSVRLSIRSHFRNRYLSFYWKKWLHIYFLFTVRLTNERVGVFLVRHSVQHLGFFYQNLRRAVLKMILVKYTIKWKKNKKNTTCHDDRTFTFKKNFIVIVVDMSLSS